MYIDFDHPGIGRHLDDLDPRIVRRRIALDMHLHLHLFGGRLDRRNQFEIIFQLLYRRHERAENAVANLDRHRRAYRAGFRRLLFLYLLLRRTVRLGGIVINRERLARLHRVLLDDVGKILFVDMGQ